MTDPRPRGADAATAPPDPLDAFGAWPSSLAAANADAVIRYRLVSAYAAHSRPLVDGAGVEADAVRVVADTSIAVLLIAMQRGATADEAATTLYRLFGEGEEIADVAAELLKARGIDPDAVAAVAAEHAANRQHRAPA